MLSTRNQWDAASHSEKANFFEFVIEDLILAVCKPGDTVIDIGANYGAHAYTMMLRVGRAGRVFAFEPNPDVFETISSWSSKNPQFMALRMALSDHSGIGNLTIPDAGLGYGSLTARDGGGKSFAVDVRRLDDLPQIRASPNLSLIKIDVEGEEIRVLQGAMETIVTTRPIVLVEISWRQETADLFRFLKLNRYAAYDFFGERIEAPDDRCWNAALVPDEFAFSTLLKPRIVDVGAEFFSMFASWNPYQKLS